MKEIIQTTSASWGVPSSPYIKRLNRPGPMAPGCHLSLEVIGDHTTTDFASMDKLCGALVQYPDTRGRFNKFEGIADALHKTLGETW